MGEKSIARNSQDEASGLAKSVSSAQLTSIKGKKVPRPAPAGTCRQKGAVSVQKNRQDDEETLISEGRKRRAAVKGKTLIKNE